MNRNNISKSALTYLIIGLLIIVITAIICRYLLLSDLIKGLFTGLGLTMEFITLVKIRQSNKKTKCVKA